MKTLLFCALPGFLHSAYVDRLSWLLNLSLFNWEKKELS